MKFNTGAITLFLSLALKVYGKGYSCKVHSVVRSGDSCNDFTHLQNEHYIRMKDFLSYNPLIDCDHLKEGQKVCMEPIDLEIHDSSKTGVYRIQESDTYEGIAEKLGTSPEVLERINEHTYTPKTGGDASRQAGNEVIYRLDKCYEPDFSKSEEYVIPKHSSTTTTTKKSITKTVTKKSTTKTSTKKRTTKASTRTTVTKTTTKSSHHTHTSSSEYRCDKHVVVKRGYTCSKIYSNKNVNISYKKFMKLNPHITCFDLQIGEKVCVSSSKAGHEKDPNFDKSKRIYLH